MEHSATMEEISRLRTQLAKSQSIAKIQKTKFLKRKKRLQNRLRRAAQMRSILLRTFDDFGNELSKERNKSQTLKNENNALREEVKQLHVELVTLKKKKRFARQKNKGFKLVIHYGRSDIDDENHTSSSVEDNDSTHSSGEMESSRSSEEVEFNDSNDESRSILGFNHSWDDSNDSRSSDLGNFMKHEDVVDLPVDIMEVQALEDQNHPNPPSNGVRKRVLRWAHHNIRRNVLSDSSISDEDVHEDPFSREDDVHGGGEIDEGCQRDARNNSPPYKDEN